MSCDPRDGAGPFGDLLRALRQCKESRTCPSLRVRSYYFEPNPETAGAWRSEGLYQDEIDRRVMFFCESPSSSGSGTDSAAAQRNWAATFRDRRFWQILDKYGLANCYVTDLVKCGVRQEDGHTEAEIEACSPFLLREIEFIQPVIAVGVGARAMRILRTRIAPRLEVPPVLFRITHYSAHGNPYQAWDQEFPELRRLLSRLRPRTQWEL